MITPWDNLRFMVPSRNGEKDYLVDLAEYDGNGSCNCSHFKFRLESKVKLGVKRHMRCKHIVAARDYLASALIERMSDAEEKTEPNKQEEAGRVERIPETATGIS
jgi:hypothetical protein